MLYMLPDQCHQSPCCRCHATPAFPYGDACLDPEEDYLIPRILVEARQVFWLCEECWVKMVTEDNERQLEEIAKSICPMSIRVFDQG
jgi:hypothetical protein